MIDTVPVNRLAKRRVLPLSPRRAPIRSLLLFTAVLVMLCCAPRPSLAACGNDGIVIQGRSDEVAAACAAIEQVGGYFAQLGYAVSPALEVRFEDVVLLPTGGNRTRPVLGMFDEETGRIEVTSGDSSSEGTRAMWDIPWGTELAYSILQHELVHAFTRTIPSSPKDFVSREYLA